ncbi:MAG: hypothetical protein ABI632_04305 [Pseudolysinimonas sp.]
MTSPSAATENVTRGAILSLLAIPAAVILFAIVGGIFGGVSGIAAIAVPYVAAALYRFGAGAALSRAGWLPFIVISAIAVLVGTFSGIAASAWQLFNSVGGKNALVNPAFWRTVGNQFTTNLGDNFIGIAIGLVLGIVGIVGILRGRTIGTPAGGRVAPADVAALENPYAGDATAAAAPPVPPAPPAPNAPSPGVILNGKPIEPEK